MRYLSAAGPFIRRRLRPPAIPNPTPTATLDYADAKSCVADVYVPDGVDGAPSAMVVHGGGFVGGSRRMTSVRVLIDRLLRSGMVVVSVDYRLVRPWGPFLQGQAQDVRAAAEWWAQRAPEFAADPQRSALVGLSAGGGLALMASEVATFSRFVGIYGAYDLTLLPVRWATAAPLAGSARRHEQHLRSPLSSGLFAQPALLIHGDQDPLAVPEHTARLSEHRLREGLSTQVHWVKGGVHGYLQDGAEHPHSAETLDVIDRFLAPL